MIKLLCLPSSPLWSFARLTITGMAVAMEATVPAAMADTAVMVATVEAMEDTVVDMVITAMEAKATEVDMEAMADMEAMVDTARATEAAMEAMARDTDPAMVVMEDIKSWF